MYVGILENIYLSNTHNLDTTRLFQVFQIIDSSNYGGRLHIFGNIGSGHHQTSGDERKYKKRVLQNNTEASRNIVGEISSNA